MGVQSIAYNYSFEKSVCRALAAMYPDLAPHLLNIVDNMIDLMVPFQKKWVTSPAMHGSYSIKAVLPVLCGGDPALDYHALPVVHNGAEAMATFATLHLVEDPQEVQRIRDGLKQYCCLDTLAMVKVLDALYDLLVGRKKDKPEGSYTTYLFEKGVDKILKKVGEESTEVIIAGKANDKNETVYEIADLAYHVLVLMAQMGITVEEVQDELASRHIIDHKVKQEKMTK
jgi:phosphoribosyl-ATP pyrophosphohydrolase